MTRWTRRRPRRYSLSRRVTARPKFDPPFLRRVTCRAKNRGPTVDHTHRTPEALELDLLCFQRAFITNSKSFRARELQLVRRRLAARVSITSTSTSLIPASVGEWGEKGFDRDWPSGRARERRTGPLDLKQSVVLRQSLRAGERTDFDLAGVERDRQVGDCNVASFARAGRDDGFESR